MTKKENIAFAKAELILMGRTQAVNEWEVAVVIARILEVLMATGQIDESEGAAGVLEKAFEHCAGSRITHIGCSKIFGEYYVLNLVLVTPEDETIVEIDDKDGVFAFCYNMTDPFLSELGYMCFERKKDGSIARIS